MINAPRFREKLPQLSGDLFLVDGGIETTLIFHEGIDLPHFATFHLLNDSKYEGVLDRYYAPYLEIAKRARSGFIFESLTWRANEVWGNKLGYSKEALAEVNRRAVELCCLRRSQWSPLQRPVVVSACVGPRGDGYVASDTMSIAEAQAYHETQIGVLSETAADSVSAATLNYVEEAIGIALAAAQCCIPVILSFTVEIDGRLPNGETLKSAILRADEATAGYVSYYGINCAHPSHFEHLLCSGEAWTRRIRAVRGNASRLSHAELDGATVLDEGDPVEFGAAYQSMLGSAAHLNVLGGCCGTDHRHVGAIAQRCASRS